MSNQSPSDDKMEPSALTYALTRRRFLRGTVGASTLALTGSSQFLASAAPPMTPNTLQDAARFASKRPALQDRRFTSTAVEAAIQATKQKIADPELAWLFENCFPNTLDTTVFYKEHAGKPDTYVITGDIDAMWLRDSTAQVWPYLPLTAQDAKLHKLIAGVIHRQARCILLSPYANAFFDDPNEVSEWASDYTLMQPGVHEHKWEIDSLCYPIRLAYGFWKQTGDTSVFDAQWEAAMDTVVQTFREQQRIDGDGPYYFFRGQPRPEPGSPAVYGSPVKPVGLICSRFRPSDDETTYQFLIPSNLFAVRALRQLAEILDKVRHKPAKAAQATAFANEVEAALKQYAQQQHPTAGTIYAYEVDGLGHVSMMDDANVPSLLSLPYLGVCKTDDPVYQATRRFVWSKDNPWFFEGKYKGIGGPHIGKDMIWPMSLTMYGLTSTSPEEVAFCLQTLKATHAGTGFMHESFHINDPAHFTRSWFAWSNTLFGEFVLQTAQRFPQVLQTIK